MNVHVACVGCEQRDLDAQQIVDFIRRRGGEISDSPRNCDCAVVITCTVDEFLVQESLALLERTRKSLPDGAKLLVGGCLPTVSPELVSRFNPNAVFTPRSMQILESHILEEANVDWADIPTPNRSAFDLPVDEAPTALGQVRDEYDRAKRGFKVVISRGCLGNCSYCVIRLPNGRLSSVPVEEVIKQISMGVSQGEPSAMLMGGDTGAYGLDIGSNLPTLLEKILRRTGISALFVHDLGPQWIARDIDVYEALFGTAAARDRIRTLCVPVQSGSDLVLARMGRYYTADDVRDSIRRLRRSHPELAIGTHIIAGFPGETEQDFLETLRLTHDCKFDFVTAFPYADHQAAGSHTLDQHVDKTLTRNRLERLRHCANNVKILG